MWKKEKLRARSTAEVEAPESATATLPLQSGFDAPTKTIQTTSARHDASFQQLHVLRKEHPQSSLRAGEVGLHHGEWTSGTF